MSGTELGQAEADALLGLAKVKVDDMERQYPGLGGFITIPLITVERREQFLLDISRGNRGGHLKFQLRARNSIILARLDYYGRPHTNPLPDGRKINCPHLHLYREGSRSDEWAFPVPIDRFPHLNDSWQTLFDFMDYCQIVDRPQIVRGKTI